MNEEKNNMGTQNIGINNGGLPPMNTVSTGSVNSQNMSANNLPPMGSTPSAPVQQNNNTVNIQDKYGLPPISNFTNFNDSYETPKVDNNTSVFDLMDRFESVNSNINVNNVEHAMNNFNPSVNTPQQQTSNIQNATISNPVVTPNLSNQRATMEQSQMNSIQNINNSTVQSVASNSGNQMSNMNPSTTLNSAVSIPSNNNVIGNNQENISMPSIPILNQNNGNNIQPNNTGVLNMFSENGIALNNQPQQSNVSNKVDAIIPQQPANLIADSNLNNNDNVSQNSINLFESIINDDQVKVDNSLDAVTAINTPSINNQVVSNNHLSAPVVNDVQNVSNDTAGNSLENMINGSDTSLTMFEQTGDIADENSVNNSFESQIEDNNVTTPIEIPTTSIDSLESNSTIESGIANNNNNSIKKEEKPKKKKHKLLFIVLLIFTLIILTAVGVLSYFMFFKTDKLVCSMQDYSNDEYLLEESIVYRFKGNNITKARRTQNVMLTEENTDKKSSYLEELKNQYQGLGFNVSFTENETGFDINMDFTKSELESWYGQKFNNYSKAKLKKEMRESGYTCK